MDINYRGKQVVLEPTEPWEGGFISNFTSCVESLPDGQWRIWYSAGTGPDGKFTVAFAEGSINQEWKRYPAVLNSGEPTVDVPFAIGNLPEGWKLVQPVHISMPDGRQRLYFWAHGPGVVRYIAAESEDGNQRYTVLNTNQPCLYHPNDRAANNDEITTNDATNVYLLTDGTYEMYTVGLVKVQKEDPRYVSHDNAAGLVRVIDRLTSRDGLTWGNRRRVLQPDAQDAPGLQFYYLSVTQTPERKIGMLGHYRADNQTTDIELCFSNDGVTWERPYRKPWIQRGKPGEPDCYGIYAPHALVFSNGSYLLFYSGTNYTHNFKIHQGPCRSVIMLTSCDLQLSQ